MRERLKFLWKSYQEEVTINSYSNTLYCYDAVAHSSTCSQLVHLLARQSESTDRTLQHLVYKLSFNHLVNM